MTARKSKLTTSELALLRHDAFTFFTLDTDCIGLDEMAHIPPYDQVGKMRLKKWADEDEWLVCRQKNLGRWRKLVEEKLGQSLVEQKMRQLDQMRGLWDQGIHLVNNTRLPSNSWEGAVGALTRLADVMDRWRDSLGGAAVPIEGEHPGRQGASIDGILPAQSMPKLSSDEARAAAHLILRQRQLDALGGKGEEDVIEASYVTETPPTSES